MNARGRPRKNTDEQLIERAGTHLRPKDKRRLEYIASVTGIAPEIHVRAAVLEYMRKKERDDGILSAI